MSKYLKALNSLMRSHKLLANADDIQNTPEAILILYYIGQGLTIADIENRTMQNQSLILFYCNYFYQNKFISMWNNSQNMHVEITESGMQMLQDYIKKLDDNIKFNDKIYNRIVSVENALSEMLSNVHREVDNNIKIVEVN